MRQALHIFRKDVRFLWVPISLALSLTTAFAWSRAGTHPDAVRQPITTLLILGWWYLAASVIYKETLVGDRQFWVTRPYRWPSLLAAKALLLFAFIHVPFLAADLTILAGQGFAPSVRTLVWRQLGLAALITLPAAAIASVTRTVAALAMTSVAALTCILIVFAQFDTARTSWPTAEWIRGSAMLAVLFATAAATLLWQYARRRTAPGRAVASSGFALFLAVMIAPPFGSWILARTPADPAGLRSVRIAATEPVPERFSHLTLRVEGVPAGMRAAAELVKISVEDAQGHEWQSQWVSRSQGRPGWDIQWNPDVSTNTVFVSVQPWGMAALGGPPAKVRASVILSIYGPGTTESVALDGRRHATAIGRCSFRRQSNSATFEMNCWNSEYVQKEVRLNDATVAIGPFSYIEYVSASPVLESSSFINMTPPPGDTLTLTTDPRITRIRRDVEIPIQEHR
jgi:hypothetical protein